MPPVAKTLSAALRPGLSRLRILATSDLHVHITPWDYHSDRTSAAFGLARTASLIAAARAEVACCILLDNGDFLQGSPMGDVEALRTHRPGDAKHPMIAAMNALHYDAATLGNHEFSNGLDFLLRQLAGAEFPVISANVLRQLGDTPLGDQTLVPPTVILSRQLTDADGTSHPLRIGIIGLAPPQTTQWDRQQLGTAVQTRDILEAATAHVPKLRAEGADIVIALSHSGIGSSIASANMENASAALAALPGIDALIAGHTHQTFPSPDFLAQGADVDPVQGRLWGKPAVMPGFHGSHLGVIDLYLNRRADRWHLAASHAELRPIAKRSQTGRLTALTHSAPEILAIAKVAHQATRQWSMLALGHNPTPLHSYFAMISASPAVRLVARAQAAHVARRLAGGPYASLPLISAAAPFHAGGRGGPDNYTHVGAGPLVMRHAYDLYPHPNTIAALLVTGAELTQWLERSFSQFNRITAGAQDAPLLNPDFPSFNFDTLEGLDWQVDLTAPPAFDTRGTPVASASRIRNLSCQGRPVDAFARFILASNSYRAGGSGAFAGATPDRIILSGPESNRDILLAHIAGQGLIPASGAANWRFVAMPGTSVTFESAPDAAAHLPELGPAKAAALDIGPNGFRRYRLHL